MLNKIIAIYAIIDDLLKAIGHDEDVRIRMSDAEIAPPMSIRTVYSVGQNIYIQYGEKN